jgi:hypothetical protein
MYSICRHCVWLWGGGGCWIVLETTYCRNFTLCFWPDSEPIKLIHHPKQMTSKDDNKGLVSFKFLRPWGRGRRDGGGGEGRFVPTLSAHLYQGRSGHAAAWARPGNEAHSQESTSYLSFFSPIFSAFNCFCCLAWRNSPLVLFVAGGPEFSRPPFFYLIAAVFELSGGLSHETDV